MTNAEMTTEALTGVAQAFILTAFCLGLVAIVIGFHALVN